MKENCAGILCSSYARQVLTNTKLLDWPTSMHKHTRIDTSNRKCGNLRILFKDSNIQQSAEVTSLYRISVQQSASLAFNLTRGVKVLISDSFKKMCFKRLLKQQYNFIRTRLKVTFFVWGLRVSNISARNKNEKKKTETTVSAQRISHYSFLYLFFYDKRFLYNFRTMFRNIFKWQ